MITLPYCVIFLVFHMLIKLAIFCSCDVMFKLNKLLLSLVSHMPKMFTGSLVHLYHCEVIKFEVHVPDRTKSQDFCFVIFNFQSGFTI